MPKILCIDDDHYLTDLLRYGLTRADFDVATTNSGREGLRLVRVERFDLVILDVNIPDMNGFKVLAALRTFSAIPVIMLTARAQDEDIIAGFGEGADDYVSKPFSMQVLVTRVKAVLRRGTVRAIDPVENANRQAYHVAGAMLDTETNELAAGEARVRLTPTESRILQLLLTHEGQVLAAERIMERIWGYNSDSDVNVIKTHIRRLREKILRLPGNPQPIRTLPGVGYVLNDLEQDSATDLEQDSATDLEQDSATDLEQDSATDLEQDSATTGDDDELA